MAIKVVKRDGREVDYDVKKIKQAIHKAVVATKGVSVKGSKAQVDEAIDSITKEIESHDGSIGVEDIQDIVETSLMKCGLHAVAKQYILYRAERSSIREMSSSVMQKMKELTFVDANDIDLKRENANIDGNTAMGTMLRYGSEVSKEFVNKFILDKDMADAHINGDIHIHDEDFYPLTMTCVTGDTLLTVKCGSDIKTVRADSFDGVLKNVADDTVVCTDGIEILSGNEFVKMKNCVRHSSKNKKVLEIITKTGSIRVTDDHIIPIRVAGGTVDTKACDLKVGDTLITNESKCSGNLQYVNLIDLFGSTNNIVIHNSKELLQMIKDSGHWKDFCDSIGYKGRAKSIRNGNTRVTLKDYIEHIRGTCSIDERLLRLSYRHTRCDQSINAVLRLTRELGKFIGYMLSDGSISKFNSSSQDSEVKEACFTQHNEDSIREFNRCAAAVFNNVKLIDRMTYGNISGTILSGYLCYELFHGPLGVKNSTGDIELPKWVYSANTDFISGLIGGLIDGDGTVQEDGYSVRYASASECLVGELQMLLLLNGIKSKIHTEELKGTVAKFGNTECIRNYDGYRLIITEDAPKLKFVDSCKIKDRVRAVKEHRNTCLDDIIEIKEVTGYSDYVYDFETENHYFNANGFKVHNCCQIDVSRLLKGGFSTGHGVLREPNGIGSYAALTAIAIQANQNDMHELVVA